MKNVLTFAIIALLILAVLITYLGLQRDTIVNPPVVTGVGFLIVAVVFFMLRKRL
ncbi:hypothetical protein LV716_14775 [Flagellimonas sp. HMM57]|uniref:hypothetical protein n=1 Tax=unclassified Flagellimonas TaxID=2644544 RepID=UPI0013D6CE72|nr:MULTISPECIES: hypothetical protein [unclassified Flagellimonas]UII75511.1 hypothetical protein LV716_14775 [Flagellimonas sp. HMM57]